LKPCARSGRRGRGPRPVRARHRHHRQLKLSDFSIPFSPLDLALPKVPVGVPSQLLERRPDIAAAERRAAAANAQIGIAVSAFYPTINLAEPAALKACTPAPGFRAPARCGPWGRKHELLFDAGQRHALTDQARHSYEAQAAAYRNTVPAAFNDVEDQLSGLRILEQESPSSSGRRVGAAFLRSLQPALQGRRHQLP
jgi:outer membrane protein TolC